MIKLLLKIQIPRIKKKSEGTGFSNILQPVQKCECVCVRVVMTLIIIGGAHRHYGTSRFISALIMMIFHVFRLMSLARTA